MEIYNELKNKHHVPIILCGDFNGKASPKDTEHEFTSIYKNSDLKELFDHLSIEEERRLTHIQFLSNGQVRHLQLDYIFSTQETFQHVIPEKCGVYRIKNKGAELPLPTNLTQRFQMHSDHYPIVMTLNTESLFTFS